MHGYAIRSVVVSGTSVVNSHSMGHGLSTSLTALASRARETEKPSLASASSLFALCRGDQVQSSELIVLAPAPPIGEFGLPAQVLGLRHQRMGRGGLPFEQRRGDHSDQDSRDHFTSAGGGVFDFGFHSCTRRLRLGKLVAAHFGRDGIARFGAPCLRFARRRWRRDSATRTLAHDPPARRGLVRRPNPGCIERPHIRCQRLCATNPPPRYSRRSRLARARTCCLGQ